MSAWKVRKFRELDELNLFLTGAVIGSDISYFGNSVGGGIGGARDVPALVGTSFTLVNPPGSVTFVAGADPNGRLLFKELKAQIEGAIAGVLVRQFEGRICLVESSPSTGTIVAAGPGGGFATVDGTVNINTLAFGGGGTVDGETIVFKHNGGGNLSVTFVAPVNAADVLAQINAVTGPGILATLDPNGDLHLQTNDQGAGKSITINAGGTATAHLGLTAGTHNAASTNTANAVLGYDTSNNTSGKVYGSPYVTPPVAPYFGWGYSDNSNMHIVYTFE